MTKHSKLAVEFSLRVWGIGFAVGHNSLDGLVLTASLGPFHLEASTK